MFAKILIANRGEIACRIIASARKMGIATVAVYSEADKEARHVRLADEAVCIGPAASRESYLRADKILQACKDTGAQAVHPGYGFLSENEAFAAAVEAAGLAFIGPGHGAIAAMGDKIASKRLAHSAGVNTIPGYNDVIQNADEAVKIAQKIGYPVMIKASAGGGGKGLRVAYNDAEAHEGFSACTNEAQNSFGDDRVFIEKFVEEPRHIEIQILGDAHGNVVYLWERECSIQRRHQKVIEEAPSPFISEQTRKAMGEQAVALAKAVQYRSAGTVEFVVGKDQSFYFLEMNTRLQVEHPVTECITGLDLVEWMIRVAAGEKLSFTQAEIRRDGWAMECRINAEDPLRNFLPSTGRLVRFSPPATTLQAAQAGQYGVRVDTGVFEGGEISMHYDSMIAKLIVHGKDRADAIARMRAALNGFVVRGVATSIPFQATLLGHADFAAGNFNTGFIATHFPHGLRIEDQIQQDHGVLIALAAFVRRKSRERAAGISGQLPGYGVNIGNDYCVVAMQGPKPIAWHNVRVEENTLDPNSAHIVVDDQAWDISSASRLSAIRIEAMINGQDCTVQVERGSPSNPLALVLQHNGARLECMVISPRMAELYKLMPVKTPPDMSRFLLAPMPGLLRDINVSVGQSVRAGERLAVIEAMKMENTLSAARDGVIKAINVQKGSSLSVDEVILEFA